MKKQNYPIPENEISRLMKLSDLDIDYSDLSESFKDLTHLAAKVAGTEISLVNLIDAYTQWTVSGYGIELQQMTREESVCQYTIMGNDQFEVPDLSQDERFNKNFYVHAPLDLRYYFGIPLQDGDDVNIGALCVLDTQKKSLTPEKIELLKIIAGEIVNRIKIYRAIEGLKSQVKTAEESKKKVAHDIRGPLAGIIGLSEIISEQGKSAKLDDVIEFINLIHSGGKSLLDLADEILSDETKATGTSEFNLGTFRSKLKQLFEPQATYKKIRLRFNINTENQHIRFAKNKLLQIAGNLISNAIKFTPEGGQVNVHLNLLIQSDKNVVSISVTDTGTGMKDSDINKILSGNANSTKGTGGETGYGFGLSLVKHLVENLGGTMEITSALNEGTTFNVQLPQREI